MTHPNAETVETERLLATSGITVTAEGRQRARRKLDEADAYWTTERRADAQERFLRTLDSA
jgi:hypothetical protein